MGNMLIFLYHRIALIAMGTQEGSHPGNGCPVSARRLGDRQIFHRDAESDVEAQSHKLVDPRLPKKPLVSVPGDRTETDTVGGKNPKARERTPVLRNSQNNTVT